MKSLNHWNERESGNEISMTEARELFWLAFLFTSSHKMSESALLRALEQDFDATVGSCRAESLRAAVIGEVLCALHSQVAASRRISERLINRSDLPTETLPDPRWNLGREVKTEEFESGLAALDVFPRCVLLLTIFEKLTLEHVAGLLETSTRVAAAAQVSALTQLTKSVAIHQGWFANTEHASPASKWACVAVAG